MQLLGGSNGFPHVRLFHHVKYVNDVIRWEAEEPQSTSDLVIGDVDAHRYPSHDIREGSSKISKQHRTLVTLFSGVFSERSDVEGAIFNGTPIESRSILSLAAAT